MATVRVTRSGDRQTICLPEEFHVSSEEVEIFRRGNEIVLKEPQRNLLGLYETLRSLPEDFLADGLDDPPPQERRGL